MTTARAIAIPAVPLARARTKTAPVPRRPHPEPLFMGDILAQAAGQPEFLRRWLADRDRRTKGPPGNG